jgi:hypothetical protein
MNLATNRQSKRGCTCNEKIRLLVLSSYRLFSGKIICKITKGSTKESYGYNNYFPKCITGP